MRSEPGYATEEREMAEVREGDGGQKQKKTTATTTLARGDLGETTVKRGAHLPWP